MKPFFRKKLPYILIALEAVLIAGILLYIVPGRFRLYDIVLYDAPTSGLDPVTSITINRLIKKLNKVS